MWCDPGESPLGLRLSLFVRDSCTELTRKVIPTSCETPKGLAPVWVPSIRPLNEWQGGLIITSLGLNEALKMTTWQFVQKSLLKSP